MLVPDFAVQRPGGRWLLSRAAVISSAAYAIVGATMATAALDRPPFARLGLNELELLLGALVLFFTVGLALSVLRERSLSLLPGLIVQLAGVGIITLAWAVLS